MGCARKLIFSWGGNPGVGSLHRFRDAVEHGWPAPLEIEEHSHAGLTNRYVAGASGLPFAVLRGYAGTGLEDATETVKTVDLPLHRRAAGRGRRPAPRRRRHPRPAGRPGRQRPALGYHRRAERGGPRRDPLPRHRRGDRRPPRAASGWHRAAVVGGDAPSPMCPAGPIRPTPPGIRERDNDFYQRGTPSAGTGTGFRAWMDDHVTGRRGA